MKKKFIYIGIIVVIIILFIGIKRCSGSTKVTFETAPAKTATVSNVVTATGTIQAIKTVEVGTQVSGVIDKIYVDYNSHVKKGQLLAELDRKTLLAELESAKATLDKSKSDADYQSKNYERMKTLFNKGFIAQTDYDVANNSYKQSQATLKAAQSTYNKAKTNLSYAEITSPIDGTILSRAVDEGQTVAASFSTPTLFTIAQDLTQMQVEANIDEADIGQVKLGQKVTFNVDAYSDSYFTGEVIQIRLEPTTTSNVVTYTVIIKAPNPDLMLMPGMTANISIITKEAKDVLTIPSKALRFSPDSDMMVKYYQSLPESERPKLDKIHRRKISFADNTEQKSAKIWIKEGVKVHPIDVELGVNDETNVQILRGLKSGVNVVLSMTDQAEKESGEAKTQSSSPFMPKRPGRNK